MPFFRKDNALQCHISAHQIKIHLITCVWSDLEPVEVTYVNMLGMQSAAPFDGMNIVVTRYSNGMITAIKVMR